MFNNALESMALDGIVFTGKPRQYRSDCQSGQFKIGASKFVGKDLKMEILAWRTFEDELFSYQWQQWLEIIFIDPKNVVSHILFKTESMDNFLNLALELSQAGIPIGSQTILGSMSKRSSATNGNSYFAVEFESQPMDPDRFQEILLFANEIEISNLSISGGSSTQPQALPPAPNYSED
jgi:hypothetical protein